MSRRTLLLACYRCRWLLVVVIVAALYPLAWADPLAPGARDRITSEAVSRLLQQHLTRHPLDNEISERCLKEFLKRLDLMKVYFYQSDVDEFMKHKDELADAIGHGDVSFAYTVFRKFLERVDERIKTVDELLPAHHDFAVDEQIVKEPESAHYPRDPAEARDLWRKRIKYELLALKADKKIDGKKAQDKLAQRYGSFVRRMHQIDSEDLLEMYLDSFTESFDPHTSYMSPESEENFDIAMSLELKGGIGASLVNEDGFTVVKKLVPGGVAAKSGQLKVDDKIIAVGQGSDGPMVDVTDMKLGKVVQLIRGKPGEVVRVDVMPANDTPRKTVKIVREKIELKDAQAKGVIFQTGRKADGTPYRVGVIDLPSFYRDMAGDRAGLPNFRSTTRDVHAILDDFNRKHVDAVILDLRYNGGGSLPEAISLTGLFIGEGPVVQVKDPEGRVQHLDDTGSDMVWSGPLVVLINKYSASASEIFAGAIQDYGRGLIVGDHATHGKGTVQSLMDLGQTLLHLPGEMGALKITTQQFYRPDGDSTQKRGVVSDVELPSVTTHLDVGEADLDYPVPFDSVTPLQYKHYNYVSPAICDRLRQLSQQRVQASEKFQKVNRRIARYKEQKANKYTTLNEVKFLKEWAALNADKEEEKAIEKRNELSGNTIDRDYYLDEALSIVADYVNLTHAAYAQSQNAGLGAAQ
jgi:carboxyl-terminal processing protease